MNATELLDKLESRYGSLDDESGCYVSGSWLSVKDIVDLIDDSNDEYDLADKIEAQYGSLDDESGCYVNGSWLSVKDIVDLIGECYGV